MTLALVDKTLERGIAMNPEEMFEVFGDFDVTAHEAEAKASPAVMDLAERCSHAMHASLGQMYVGDPRFAAHYEQRREGLAQLVCDAIAANLVRSSARG